MRRRTDILFKIDYVFQKGGPVYSCHYPNQEVSNNNIFIIKGRNDQGKSTIMQIVALGLNGLESKDIDNTLKEKMKRLISGDAKCDYDFIIVSNDEKTSLEIHRKDGQSIVKVNSKIKNTTYVDENFKILFDVPDDPTKKLISSLRSIENNLLQYESYAQNYLTNIQHSLDAIENWEDKERRLNEENQNLRDKKNTLKQIEERWNEVKERFEKLEKCRVINTYDDLNKECNRREVEKGRLEKRIKELKA